MSRECQFMRKPAEHEKFAKDGKHGSDVPPPCLILLVSHFTVVYNIHHSKHYV